MKLKNKVKPAIPPLEAGTYAGVCVGVYAVGEQENTYQGRTRYVEQIVITFEFPEVTVEIDGEARPRQLSKTFTASTSEKSGLRKCLKTWRGRDFASGEEMANFDLNQLLGRSALVQVIQKENGNAGIESVIPLPRGMADPSTQTPLQSFDVDEWDEGAFEALPEWVQDRIRNSTQWREQHAPDGPVAFPAGQEGAQTAGGSQDAEAGKTAQGASRGATEAREVPF